MQATPTVCRSGMVGSSTSGFFCVITPMILSPGMTSSSRFLLFCRPTLRGMTVPGKTTMLRIGRIGRVEGMVRSWPLDPVLMVVPVSVRSMTWVSGMNENPFEDLFLGQLDPEQPINVLGADAFLDDVLWKLHFAGEGAAIDLHQVHAHVPVLRLGRCAWRTGTGRDGAVAA